MTKLRLLVLYVKRGKMTQTLYSVSDVLSLKKTVKKASNCKKCWVACSVFHCYSISHILQTGNKSYLIRYILLRNDRSV